VVLGAQFGFEQVAVATRVVVDGGIGLQCAQVGIGVIVALEVVQHLGDAQARLCALRTAGDTAIPVQRFLVAFEEFCGLAEEQAPRRIGAGRILLELAIQLVQRRLVLGLGQQRSAQAITLVVLRSARQHRSGALAVAEGVVFRGDG